MPDEPTIPLSQMIEDLRAELQEAATRGEGQPIAFEIEKVELEAKVVVSRKGKADGKVHFWVVEAGAGYEQGAENSHVVKLTLQPKSATTGERISVNTVTGRQPSRD